MNERAFMKISNIKFSIISPKDILKMSEVKIITPELYDKYGFPVEGGLLDMRMGVIEPGLKCKTCYKGYKECEGHFGHIELARPVLNTVFIDDIYRILRMTCRSCSRVLLDEVKKTEILARLRAVKAKGKLEAYYKELSKLSSQLSKIKTCPHCGAEQKTVKLDKSSVFVFNEEETRLLPTQVRYRFENILEEDIEVLGLNSGKRPEWLVLTVLPIPPVSMRSTITLASGKRSEDDLTHKLTDVIRSNLKLSEHLAVGVPEAIIEAVWDLLQYHISTYFDNSIMGIPPARHKNGEPIKSIHERIKGKKGLIRNNLIAKRVNYSARTVISPDPRLMFNEIGVPYFVAMELTIPETVTENNIDYLRTLILNGAKDYPGANYVVTLSGRKKKIVEDFKEAIAEMLQVGDIVERHLLDGDSVILNRQPSLHKLSMMGHVVKVLPIKTFAINPGICAPYNADFDGDEMNIYVAQSLEARQEVEQIMDVKNLFISPSSGHVVMGCKEDSVSGVYILTNGLELTREEAYELLFAINYHAIGDVEFSDVVSGKEVFSVLLPKDLNFYGQSKQGTGVVVKDGQLIEGVIDAKLIGAGNSALLRLLYTKYDREEFLRSVSYIFKLGIEVLKKVGLTIGIHDFDISDKAKKEISGLNDKAYDEFEVYSKKLENKTLEKLTGRNLKESFEFKVLGLLSKTRQDAIKVVQKYVDNTSGVMTMVKAGAKGNELHIAQLHAIIGQQSLGGTRISRGYEGRTLSIFKPGDLSPKSRGYIERAYRDGMHPWEVFFSAVTGRDGLMDMALKTAKTGYLYRRIATSMLDLIIHQDHSVRDEQGNVIQFVYGDDALDISKTVGGFIDVEGIVRNITGATK